MLSGGASIPDNADLDNYKTPGNYYCSTSSRASTLKNSPFATTAFTMKVEHSSGDAYPSQTCCSYSTGQKRRRLFSNNAWGEWKTFSDDDTIKKQIAKTIDVSGTPDEYNEIQVNFDYTKMIPLAFVCSDRTGWLYTYRQVSNNVIAIHIEGNVNQPNGMYNGKLYYYEH